MVQPKTLVVKNNGRRPSEEFSRSKLHHSIVAACLAVRSSVGQAEHVGKMVTGEVITWLDDKPEVTSSDIRRVAGEHLKRYSPDAAYLYINQLSTI